MAEAGTTFRCESCGAAYRWKAELAGKKIKCKCGSVMRVPESLAGDEPATFEMSESHGDAPFKGDPPPQAAAPMHTPVPEPTGGCPDCGATLAFDAVLCVRCGYNLKTGQKLDGSTTLAVDDDDEQELAIAPAADAGKPLGGLLAQMKSGKASDTAISMGDAGDDPLWKLKQREIPIALIVAGLALQLGKAYQETQFEGADAPAFFGAAIAVVVAAVIGVALMIGAAFVAARVLEMSFGSLPAAILKFAAVTLAPSAIAYMVGSMAGDWGWVVGFPLEVGLYFGLLYWFFDLDLFELFVLAVVNWVIQNFITALLIGFLIHAFPWW